MCEHYNKYEELKKYIKDKQDRIKLELEHEKQRGNKCDAEVCVTLACELDLLDELLSFSKHVDIMK